MLRIGLLITYATMLLAPFTVKGQTVVHGVVSSQSGTALGNVFVTIVEKKSGAILCFANTNDKGAYSITYSGAADSLQVKASCLDFATQHATIANRSQQLDFTLQHEYTVLKEAVIRPRVWRNRDTVNYSVSHFAVKSDRTIADILKKLPGVEVSESGKISYNGEPINRFYVEGMDLMGGQYNVISNNLGHKSVDKVQVLENHEPVKALQEHSLSDRAAINLVLKDDARAKWLAAGKLGVGVSPLLWENELTLMRFNQTTQGSYVYKNSNTGYDVSQDLIGHYGIIGLSQSNDLLSVPTRQPDIRESRRHLFNNAHMVTANQLWKLNEDYTLRLNADYLNDQQQQNSSNKTVYYLADGSEVLVDELNHTVLNKNQAKLAFTLLGNHPKYYLQNILKAQGDWNNSLANISSSEQRLKNPSYNLNNSFAWMKHVRRLRIEVQSNSKFQQLPQSLAVRPGLYPDLLNDSIPYRQLLQEATLNDFSSDSYASLAVAKGRWKQSYRTGANISRQKLSSSLFTDGRAADSEFSNTLTFLQSKFYVSPQLEYAGKKITGGVYLPAGYILQDSNNKLNAEKNSSSRFYFNPSFTFKYSISQIWATSLQANYTSSFDDIRSIYTGYMLSSYRSLLRNSGDFSNVDAQSYSLNLSYRDPIKLASGFISASYVRSHYDKLFEQEYDGILSIRRALPYSYYSDSKSVHFSASKGFNRYIKKMGLLGSYSLSSSSLLENAVPVDYQRSSLSLRLAVNGDISSILSYDYSLQYTTTKPKLKGSSNPTAYRSISKLRQQGQLNIFPFKNLTLSTSLSHDRSYAANSLPSSFFMDLMLQYKLNRWEFCASWNNIFNTKDYVIAYYGEFYSSITSYELRPSNIVFSVRFSL